MKALQALGSALRSPHSADADELHVRRERTRLLAAFDAQLMPLERSHRVRNRVLALAVSFATFGGVFAYWRAHTAPLEASSVPVVVHADRTAQWSRKLEGTLETISLEQGALSIRVEPTPGRRRLLVIVPDGEIEDIGTRFTVSADAGRTTRVSVQSGSVVLRLKGQPPLALAAGETWSPPSRADGARCTSCAPAASVEPALMLPPASAAIPALPLPSASSAMLASPPSSASSRSPAFGVIAASPRPSASVRRTAVAPLAASANESSSAVTSAAPTHASSTVPAGDATKIDASRDFRAAMSALDSGDSAGAAARFAAFLAAHPGDSRAEDAAYLRVIALQRAGNSAGVAEAAARYLRQYPKGFRRAEMESLTH
jgi:hypothetical protein